MQTSNKDSEYDSVTGGKFPANEWAGEFFSLLTMVLNWDAALGFRK